MEVLSDFLVTDVLRIVLAIIGGSLIGLNRRIHRKPAGMRTHALTALGSAMATIVVMEAGPGDAEALGRALQGLVTGVGFIGAGVILRNGDDHVQGLTTAATIWVSAIYGFVVGFGAYALALASLVLAMFILTWGASIEKALANFLRSRGDADDED